MVSIEARTARDALHPMEVAANRSETAAVAAHAAARRRPMLLWTEDRHHPIRMLDRLPLRWLAAGTLPTAGGASHEGKAALAEFYAFQVRAVPVTNALGAGL